MQSRLESIARMIEQAADRCRRAKIPPEKYEPSLKELELACVRAVINDAHQTVARCKDPGTRIAAERAGVQPRAMRHRRHVALSILQKVGNDDA